jgi:hypothetical protein
MLLDKNGLEIYFGDVVRFNGIINHEHSAEISYDFTIEEITSEDEVWGNDIPLQYRYNLYGDANYIQSRFVERIRTKPWNGSRLKFKFN